jgi:NAD+ synthase (glutamine-hydrolysing)
VRLATLATCNLNQWALDFDGNLARIRASIAEAKARGARFRLGPELEVTGYGCEDHFLEADTVHHAWEALAELLAGEDTDGILCDVGMPVLHRGVRYNARVFVLDGRVLLIRPKTDLADDGEYRESRWFAAWAKPRTVEPFGLPPVVQAATGQRATVIGDAVIETRDARLASEMCEELFTPEAPHVPLGLDGVDIVANASGSHHELRKMATRLRRIRAATEVSGGVYLYANQQGCDGGRLYFDGGATVVVSGDVVASSKQFSLQDVDVVCADVDLEHVRYRRAARSSRMRQSARQPPFPVVTADLELARDEPGRGPSPALEPRLLSPEEEIAYGPACWLWDYLRRAAAGGFLLPLSGGSDSAAVAMIVASMCRLIAARVAAGDADVTSDLRRVLGLSEDAALPDGPRELAGRLLTTAYLPTRVSGDASRERARRLAQAIGADHLEMELQDAVDGLAAAAGAAAGGPGALRFASEGGDRAEDVALQNLQARTRLAATYLLAQRVPSLRDVRGPRLVLGTANVDEMLVGYVTKYDTSSADLNPVGGVAKTDLRRFLAWARDAFDAPVLDEVLAAAPSAELRPAGEAGPQTDEADMGLSYDELAELGRLRKVERCGPLEAFERLVAEWSALPPAEVAAKVQRFFRSYALHRHKTTVATPAYHAEAYAPDDHRFDPRPFLVDAAWKRQFRTIDERVYRLEKDRP